MSGNDKPEKQWYGAKFSNNRQLVAGGNGSNLSAATDEIGQGVSGIGQANNKGKRDREEAGTEAEEASLGSRDQSSGTNSTRKRIREQHRRAAVAKGLDSLAKVICMIDPCLRDSATTPGGILTNRVTLINHATSVLEKIHRENEANKLRLRELESQQALQGDQQQPSSNGQGANANLESQEKDSQQESDLKQAPYQQVRSRLVLNHFISVE